MRTQRRPDEQTSVIESYRYLLINLKALAKGVLPTEVCEELAAIPSDIETIYDVYESSDGDRCLVEIVASVGAATFAKGKLYRVGGDEFCVLLPNLSRFEAAATAERVRSTVDALAPFGGTTKVTASIGVAASDGSGLANPESLVNAADEAMYVSKWTTKNRVTTWPPSDKYSELARTNRTNRTKAKRDNIR